MEITLKQLEILLNEQKRLVIEKLLGQTGYYNTQSDSCNYRSLSIDKEKFKEYGMGASYPDEYNVLKKYIID